MFCAYCLSHFTLCEDIFSGMPMSTTQVYDLNTARVQRYFTCADLFQNENLEILTGKSKITNENEKKEKTEFNLAAVASEFC